MSKLRIREITRILNGLDIEWAKSASNCIGLGLDNFIQVNLCIWIELLQ